MVNSTSTFIVSWVLAQMQESPDFPDDSSLQSNDQSVAVEVASTGRRYHFSGSEVFSHPVRE